MPVLTADNEHPVAGSGGVSLQRLQRRCEHLLFGLLAFGVDLGQALGNASGLILVAAKQQFQRHSGVIHAARRVQPRGQAVTDRVRRDRFAAATRAFQQGVQAGAHRVLQKAQPLADDGAVLPHERHHVGHGAQGGQLAVHFQQLGGVTAFQRGAKLERHARAAQIFKRAFVVGPLGVYDGNRVGERVTRQVVVRDDEVKAQFLGAGGFLDGGNAVVHRDHELKALSGQGFQRCACQAVTGTAGGQLAADVRALAGETFVQNRGGGNAVHIVVAVNDHEFFVLDGFLNAGDRFVHIL